MNYYRFNPTITKLLENYGDIEIKMITIIRKPIQSYIKNILNILSLGQLEENMKFLNYDKIFHLFMIVKLKTDENILIEKNERINILLTKDIFNQFENKKIIVNDLTINKIFSNTLKNITVENFFIYKSHSYNCQNFLINLLKYNHLLNNELNDFILQDVEKLFYKMGYIKPISDFITNLGARFDIIKQGGNINNDFVVQSIIFKKMDLNDCIKFCDNINFKYKKINDKNKNKIVISEFTDNYLKKKGYENKITQKLNNNISLKLIYK
jgi:hypothetical protein